MVETVPLLQTLIRNACVNDGTPQSGHEHRNAEVIEDVLTGGGLDVQVYEPAPGRRSLVARIEGSDPSAPSLCLMGHTDVVPVTASGWSRDPFGAELVDGEVWGRGAIDMLNLTSSMAVAVRRLADRGFRPRGTLIYLAVADEEALGSHGAKWLTENAWDAVGASYVITESGGAHIHSSSGHYVAVTVAEKGTQARRLRVRGTPGHGSRPYGADNALVKAAEVVRRVAAIRPRSVLSESWAAYVRALEVDDATRERLLDPEQVWDAARALPEVAGTAHALTHTTFAPTVVHGGVKTNVIPDVVDVDIDIRTVPGESGADVDRYLHEALGELGSDVEISQIWGNDASQSPTGTPLWDLLAEVTRRAHPDATVLPRATTGATDSAFFRPKGSVCYGFSLLSDRVDMAEWSRRFHGNDERIDVDSLDLTTDAIGHVVERLLG